MLIDSIMPEYDAMERHQTVVRAARRDTYNAIRNLDLARSPSIAALLAIRGLPHLITGKASVTRRITIDRIVRMGFVVVAEEPGIELVLGVVGKFWRLDSGIHRIEPGEFVSFDEPGFAKAAWNFRVEEAESGSCVVATETRIVATDDDARRKFVRYWRVIGPFSGLIRTRLLAAIKRAAEAVGNQG